MPSVRISALEVELPSEVVDDAVLATRLGCSESFVAELSEGRTRHQSPDGEGPAELASRAARRALDAAGSDVADVDFVVFATNTPDYCFPGSGCVLQGMLSLDVVGCLDVRAQCTGFLAGLDVARRFVMTGVYRRVLLASADVPSHLNREDGKEAELACLMGDGAAVALLEAADHDDVLATTVRSDGSRFDEFWCEYPASRDCDGPGISERSRLSRQAVDAGKHFPITRLGRLRETALEHMPQAFAAALALAGLDRVDATLVAHLLPDVETTLPGLLGEAAGRPLRARRLYTGGSALPIALAEERAAGRLAVGETVALLTAGSGASWGAAIVRVPA